MHHDFLAVVALYDYNVKMEKISSLHHCQTANTNVINLMPRFQSSPKINNMLITRLICIRLKSWRFLSPASTVSPKNVSEYIAYHLGRSHEKKKKKTEKKEKPAFLESRSLTASLSINQFSYFHMLFSHSAVPNFPIRSTIPRKLPGTW